MENTLAADIFETTRLLKARSKGGETALERLVPLVDAELRRIFVLVLISQIGGLTESSYDEP